MALWLDLIPKLHRADGHDDRFDQTDITDTAAHHDDDDDEEEDRESPYTDDRVAVVPPRLPSDHVRAVNDYVRAVSDQVRAVKDYVRAVSNQVRAVKDYVRGVEDHVRAVSNQVRAMKDHVRAVSSQVRAVKDHVRAVSNQVRAVKDYVRAVSGQVRTAKDYVRAVPTAGTSTSTPASYSARKLFLRSPAPPTSPRPPATVESRPEVPRQARSLIEPRAAFAATLAIGCLALIVNCVVFVVVYRRRVDLKRLPAPPGGDYAPPSPSVNVVASTKTSSVNGRRLDDTNSTYTIRNQAGFRPDQTTDHSQSN